MIPRIRIWRSSTGGYPWLVKIPNDAVYAFTGWRTAINFAARICGSNQP